MYAVIRTLFASEKNTWRCEAHHNANFPFELTGTGDEPWRSIHAAFTHQFATKRRHLAQDRCPVRDPDRGPAGYRSRGDFRARPGAGRLRLMGRDQERYAGLGA